MQVEQLVCWKCGASLEEVPMPLSRLSECLACRSELHVCRMCEFHDPKLAQACSEPMAEEVKEKTRANFCDFFVPATEAYVGTIAWEEGSSSPELDALFDSSGRETSEPEPAASPDDEARRRLEDIFGADD